MPKYKKGDVVIIIAKRHNSCIGRIDSVVSRKDLDKEEGSAYKVFTIMIVVRVKRVMYIGLRKI